MRRIFMVLVLLVGHMTQAGAERPQDLPVSPEAVQPLLIGSKAPVGVLADTAALSDLGYKIIAVGVDPPAKLAGSAQKWGVQFPLLADTQLQLAHAYGVAYKPADKGGLPVPAVFLVDADRVIQFEYVNPSYRIRLGRDVLLAAAREL